MSGKNEAAPERVDTTPVNAAADTQVNLGISRMSEATQMALTALLTQNPRDADIAARTADALYSEWIQPNATPEDRLELGALRDLARLYKALARALVFQIEGNFSEALEEFAIGISTAKDAIAKIDDYARGQNADNELVETYGPMFRILLILLRGGEAYVRAEIVGYQGKIRQYVELLRLARGEYLKVNQLPLSHNPTYLAMASMCAAQADRLGRRIRVFESKQEQSYLTPMYGSAAARKRVCTG